MGTNLCFAELYAQLFCVSRPLHLLSYVFHNVVPSQESGNEKHIFQMDKSYHVTVSQTMRLIMGRMYILSFCESTLTLCMLGTIS